jgi:Tfp pilus assembly protein PilV
MGHLIQEGALFYLIKGDPRRLLWNLKQGIYQSSNILRSNKGISLIEIMVAVLLLSIIVTPLFVSIKSASKSNSDADKVTQEMFFAIGKIEGILAMDFSAIPLGSSLSDTITVNGLTTNRDVNVVLSDGDGDAVPDAGLKKITVTINNISISTLKADYPYALF